MPIATARRMWQRIEPVHALVYFTPATREEFAAAGTKGFWMGYFASRAAAMGPVPADVVIATFFNFAPRSVRRALPDAWTFTTPERILAARHRAAAAALAEVAGDLDLHEAVGLARRAAAGCRPAGRPLYAAHAALPWPDEPLPALWHATTLLREHRGDGHVAALVAAGLDGCEALVTATAAGALDKESWLVARGWTDEEWEGAVARLQARGWLDETGAFTAEGRAAREAVEVRTDELSAEPWSALGEEGCARLEALLQPLLDRISRSGTLPFPNPIGLPPPS
ncbi:MAG TPA: hypothetical protein VM938_02710 [Acidimicrobiales bacterium]|nr:hypothetical protein [Acidimicrobiales bacterium]